MMIRTVIFCRNATRQSAYLEKQKREIESYAKQRNFELIDVENHSESKGGRIK